MINTLEKLIKDMQFECSDGRLNSDHRDAEWLITEYLKDAYRLGYEHGFHKGDPEVKQ
jgi:hypothetical protein